MKQLPRVVLACALTAALPTLAVAGPPLICHPFETAGAALLPWGIGQGWNTPQRAYDVQRLHTDLLTLLAPDAPILARMENLRRAAIYASTDVQLARTLLATLHDKARDPGATRLALFDAGYLIETYKQATHLFGRAVTGEDGYALVARALRMGPPSPEMEFAAALMTEGNTSAGHLRRARAASPGRPLLARNIHAVWAQ